KTSRRRLGSTILQLPRTATGSRLLAIVQQPDDGRCGLLDGSARHVDNGPAVPGAQPTRVGELIGDLGAVNVFVEIAVSQHLHAVAADLGGALGARHQPDDGGGGRPQQRQRGGGDGAARRGGGRRSAAA